MAKRLTPARIRQLGIEYEENRLGPLKAAEAKKEAIKAEILGDYNAKGIRTMEVEGVTVTRAAQTRSTVSWDYLSNHLTVKQMRAIQAEFVDKQKLAEAVAAGKIDPALVAKATEFTETAAYISVSIKKSAPEKAEKAKPAKKSAAKKIKKSA